MECSSDFDCSSERACMGGQCIDPCTLRGACGENALCSTVLHVPRCSCPNCHTGRPDIKCNPDPKCEISTTPRPRDTSTIIPCKADSDCHESLTCTRGGLCEDPCQNPEFSCEDNKKCVVRRHKPVCVCKFGFVVNEKGELTCALDKQECLSDDQCESNSACIQGQCKNPCMASAKYNPPCPPEKACQVLNHKPICICMDDCNPTISICLRDNGCPEGLACRNYQCVNPCLTATCAEDSPCYVEDHKPICKFCPNGFIKDSKSGCLKGKLFLDRRIAQIQSKTNTLTLFSFSSNSFSNCNLTSFSSQSQTKFVKKNLFKTFLSEFFLKF